MLVGAVLLFTLLAAVCDGWKHRIPNVLTVPAALLGLTYHGLTAGGHGLLLALAGLAIGFALLLLPWLMGGGGMGDVKLLAALGAWLGPKWILVDFAAAMLVAALLALLLLALGATRRGMAVTRKRYQLPGDSPGTSKRRTRIVPFAVPVALSTWALLAWMLARGIAL